VLIDGTLYTNITLDLHVDPGTTPDTNGNFGILRIGMVDQNTDAGAIPTLAVRRFRQCHQWMGSFCATDRPGDSNLNICLVLIQDSKEWRPLPAGTFTMWIDIFR